MRLYISSNTRVRPTCVLGTYTNAPLYKAKSANYVQSYISYMVSGCALVLLYNVQYMRNMTHLDMPQLSE